MARGPMLQAGLGLACGLGFAYLLATNIDIGQVGAILHRATAWPLAVALAAFILDFILRALRFRYILQASTGRAVPFAPTIGPFIASFGISDILPLRVGDGFRVVWFSKHLGINAGTVAGAMIFERILDLMSIALLGAATLALTGAATGEPLLPAFRLALAATLGGALAMLFAPAALARLLGRLFGGSRSTLLQKLIAALHAAAAALATIGSWRRVAGFAAISLALWVLESLVLWGAWVSLGGPSGAFGPLLLPFAFSTLGTLIPSLPGHFGSYEFFGLAAFRLLGVDEAMAVAVLLLAHLILWAPTALFGTAWLLQSVRRPAPGRVTKTA